MTYTPHPHEIAGHPVLELEPPTGSDPVVITVCAECKAMSSVLWLAADRWLCTRCRAEGAAPPNLYPVA